MEKINLRNAAEALKEKQAVEVLTSGRSMEPMLKEHRDIAVISRPIAPFEKGDIVLYLRGENKCVLHRIVKIKDEELVIRGDNNLFYERDIKKEDILGILTAVYRNGKYYFYFPSSPKQGGGFGVGVAIAGTIITII